MVDYTLIRARRRTAAIQIQKDGQVVVRAPMRLPKKEIERFLQEKGKLDPGPAAADAPKAAAQGAVCPVGWQTAAAGKVFPAGADRQRQAILSGRGCSACRGAGEEQLRQQAQLLYRQIAREELTRRVAFYAPKLGVQPAGLRINGAKGKVGLLLRKEQSQFQLAADAGAGALCQLCGGARAVPHFTSRPQRRLLAGGGAVFP